jgi:pyridoxal 5'-phosphate synthase pdxT subunit
MLASLGVASIQVRLPHHLDGLAGLILPGGESTVMRKLIDRWGLRLPILALAERGVPLMGTCAGMILLAAELSDGEAPVFPLLDATVRRNAFGRQQESFETQVDVPILGDEPVRGVFIRAPIVERVGPDVEVLARLADEGVVAVRQRNVMATAFHPELAGEPRFHRLLVTMARAYLEPAEGSGRRPHPTRRTRHEAKP